MILLTGAAGFIGFHTARALLARGEVVVGVDNLNDYYEPALKQGRLQNLSGNQFTFVHADIADRAAMAQVMADHPGITRIVHLAAQAGVRYSLQNPYAYEHSNIHGQMVMLEMARHCPGLKHFVYASSSSVYGGNTKQPFAVGDDVSSPVSLYAATKRAGELMVQSYSHLYALPATGLRFFTVYGPWGRPDMAYYSFAKAIAEGRAIDIYNEGNMKRDFTWIDDIVAGVIGAMDHPPVARGKYCIHDAPHRIFNLGNNRAENLLDFVQTIEQAMGRTTDKIMAPMAPGDVAETWADIEPARDVFGYDPQTPIAVGIPRFVEWFCGYYGIKRAA